MSFGQAAVSGVPLGLGSLVASGWVLCRRVGPGLTDSGPRRVFGEAKLYFCQAVHTMEFLTHAHPTRGKMVRKRMFPLTHATIYEEGVAARRQSDGSFDLNW